MPRRERMHRASSLKGAGSSHGFLERRGRQRGRSKRLPFVEELIPAVSSGSREEDAGEERSAEERVQSDVADGLMAPHGSPKFLLPGLVPVGDDCRRGSDAQGNEDCGLRQVVVPHELPPGRTRAVGLEEARERVVGMPELLACIPRPFCLEVGPAEVRKKLLSGVGGIVLQLRSSTLGDDKGRGPIRNGRSSVVLEKEEQGREKHKLQRETFSPGYGDRGGFASAEGTRVSSRPVYCGSRRAPSGSTRSAGPAGRPGRRRRRPARRP